MGLIILLLIGSLLGWLATITLQRESGNDILRNMIAGVIGSLGVGLVMSGGIFLGALRASTLLWAVFGAIFAVSLYNFARSKSWI